MGADIDLKGTDLNGALDRVQHQVRSEPALARHRILLFQLLSVTGAWDRALTQLNVLADLDKGAHLGLVHMYRDALSCEALRAEIFSGQRSPLWFGEPEQWMALLTEALRRGAEGKHGEAKALRGEALEAAPTTAGTIDGQEFGWIADGDSRLGPVLECIVNGRYYWIPMQRIAEIRVEAPTDLRDLVWLPARFSWSNGGESVGLIPTRYPGSEKSPEDSIRMARRTEWLEVDPEVFHGMGQRMLATDAGEHPILDVRQVSLASPEAGAGS